MALHYHHECSSFTRTPRKGNRCREPDFEAIKKRIVVCPHLHVADWNLTICLPSHFIVVVSICPSTKQSWSKKKKSLIFSVLLCPCSRWNLLVGWMCRIKKNMKHMAGTKLEKKPFRCQKIRHQHRKTPTKLEKHPNVVKANGDWDLAQTKLT